MHWAWVPIFGFIIVFAHAAEERLSARHVIDDGSPAPTAFAWRM
jgi:hypothetical protein